MTRTFRPATLAATIGIASAFVLGACGDDDDDAAAEQSVERSEEAYCALEREVGEEFDRVFAGLGDDATEEEIDAALVELAGSIVDRLDEGRALVPAAMEEDFEIVAAATEDLAAGDVDAYDDPAVEAANTRVDEICFGDDGS